MRILITGINGFIGLHLADKLLERGHLIVGIGRTKECKVPDIKTYYEGTVLDKKLLEKAIKDVEIVIHLAAITSHKEIVDKKSKAIATNLLGTKNVLNIFSNSKARKFLYASTGKVYGKVLYLPITENHPTNPLNILGKSKLEVEKLIGSYESDKKEFLIFRIFNVYGQGQNQNFLISTILKQLSNGKDEIVLGDMEAKRDYIYIDDLVSAFVLAIESEGQPGLSIYNICTGKGSSALQIVDMISKIKGARIKIRVDQNLKRSDEAKDEYGSFEKAQRYLGWKPKISLREGLNILCKQ